MKKISLYIILLIPSLAFANDGQNYQIQLISTIFAFLQVLSVIIGIAFLLQFLIKLKNKASNPNDPTRIHTLILWLITAGILISINTWIGIATNTIFQETTYCFALDPSQTSAVDGECFDASTSTATQELQNRISQQVSSDAVFIEYVNIAFGVIQVLGFIYFLASAMSIRKINTGGQDSVSPARPIVGMIASSLLIDLPHTLEVIINTIQLIGFQI